ncbi:MAG: hypothetical protein K2Q14_07080, partial [Gammaproteobacteria bacterium]|nr:hypothetical protein [Gammaproteobacteria bacterium]
CIFINQVLVFKKGITSRTKFLLVEIDIGVCIDAIKYQFYSGEFFLFLGEPHMPPKRKNKQAAKKNVDPQAKEIFAIMQTLPDIRQGNAHIALGVTLSRDENDPTSQKQINIAHFHTSEIPDSCHIFDTPIIQLILKSFGKNYNSYFILSTYPPTEFEQQVIKIIGIRKIYYYDEKHQIVLLNNNTQKRRFSEPTNPFKKIISHQGLDNIKTNEIMNKINEISNNNVPPLNTQDTFSWLDDLKILNLNLEEKEIQDELYMSLLYSASFILWNSTARPPHARSRNVPVAAMLVDQDDKPIAISVNTTLSDNSMTHAELGMLLRYYYRNPEQNQTLPEGSNLYTTLQSCEMCRTGLHHMRGNSDFKETYGRNDPVVECRNFQNYSLSEHHVSNAHLNLHNIPNKETDSFLDFCRANYLGLKFYLNQPAFEQNYPSLFNNVSAILDKLLAMRIKPWVGNKLLYDIKEDAEDNNLYIITEKPDYEKSFRYYYGDNISQFRQNNNRSLMHYITLNSTNGIIKINKLEFKNTTAHMENCNIISNSPGPLEIKISKHLVDERTGIITGFNLIEPTEYMGKFLESRFDINLRGKLFINTQTHLDNLANRIVRQPQPAPAVLVAPRQTSPSRMSCTWYAPLPTLSLAPQPNNNLETPSIIPPQ